MLLSLEGRRPYGWHVHGRHSHVEAWTVLCWHVGRMKVVIFTQQLLFFALLPDESIRPVAAGLRIRWGGSHVTIHSHMAALKAALIEGAGPYEIFIAATADPARFPMRLPLTMHQLIRGAPRRTWGNYREAAVAPSHKSDAIEFALNRFFLRLVLLILFAGVGMFTG
jgi:hypothetical protein